MKFHHCNWLIVDSSQSEDPEIEKIFFLILYNRNSFSWIDKDNDKTKKIIYVNKQFAWNVEIICMKWQILFSQKKKNKKK